MAACKGQLARHYTDVDLRLCLQGLIRHFRGEMEDRISRGNDRIARLAATA